MLLLLKFLSEIYNNCTDHTSSHITHFISLCATNPELSIDYSHSDIILYAYLVNLYLLGYTGRSWLGGHFFLGTQLPNIGTNKISYPDVPVHIEIIILWNFLISLMEVELGRYLYNICQVSPWRLNTNSTGISLLSPERNSHWYW